MGPPWAWWGRGGGAVGRGTDVVKKGLNSKEGGVSGFAGRSRRQPKKRDRTPLGQNEGQVLQKITGGMAKIK